MYSFSKLFGDGSGLRINITNRSQKVQRGTADAFIIGKSFIGDDSVCLIQGDNIFCGEGLIGSLKKARQNFDTTFLGYFVDDRRPFEVLEFDESGKAIFIEQKTSQPKSNYIVPSLCFYENSVVEIAERV